MILHRRNKFYPNWTITHRVVTLCRFSKMAAIWRPYHRKSTFAFWFYDVSHLGRQRIIRIPNFDQTCQSTAEILLLLVAENKRPSYLNSTPGFDFDFIFIFTVRLHVMQRTVLLSQFCLSVCPSDACIVTKLNNTLRIF